LIAWSSSGFTEAGVLAEDEEDNEPSPTSLRMLLTWFSRASILAFTAANRTAWSRCDTSSVDMLFARERQDA
jgi:hypothetical protein